MIERKGAIDLSPLDPEKDPERLERVVARVIEQLGPGPVEATPSLSRQMARLYEQRFVPLFTAASVVALAAGVVLLASEAPQPTAAEGGADRSGSTASWASWAVTGIPPAAEDLLFSLAGEDR